MVLVRMVRQMGGMMLMVLRVDRWMRLLLLLLPHSQLVGIAARRALHRMAGNVGRHGRHSGCQR